MLIVSHTPIKLQKSGKIFYCRASAYGIQLPSHIILSAQHRTRINGPTTMALQLKAAVSLLSLAIVVLVIRFSGSVSFFW